MFISRGNIFETFFFSAYFEKMMEGEKTVMASKKMRRTLDAAIALVQSKYDETKISELLKLIRKMSKSGMVLQDLYFQIRVIVEKHEKHRADEQKKTPDQMKKTTRRLKKTANKKEETQAKQHGWQQKKEAATQNNAKKREKRKKKQKASDLKNVI